jgi:nitroreductase
LTQFFNKFIKDSSITIVGCANMGDVLTGKWSIVDTTIALQNMVIAAWTIGVGSCWVGDFNEDKVKQLLNVQPLKSSSSLQRVFWSLYIF